MIRNVHNRICAEDFALKLDELGFEGQYDFCVIPTDPMSGRGKGFGFMSFLTPHAAARFCSIAETISFPHASAKHLQVEYQGRHHLEPCVERHDTHGARVCMLVY